MAVSIINPLEHELDHTELGRRDYGTEIRYFGSREAFDRSDLVPDGVPYPGEIPGKRGSRWRDADGRRFVLAKRTKSPPSFCLTIYLTAQERQAITESQRVKDQLEKLNKEIHETDISKEYFRRQCKAILGCGFAFSDNAVAGNFYPWRYSPQVMDALDYHCRELFTLLADGEVMPKPETLDALKKRFASLSDTKFRRAMLKLVQ